MGGRGVKITAANVLLRALVADDAEQAVAARALLLQASVVAVPVPVFCELYSRRGNGRRCASGQMQNTVYNAAAVMSSARRHTRAAVVTVQLSGIMAGR